MNILDIHTHQQHYPNDEKIYNLRITTKEPNMVSSVFYSAGIHPWDSEEKYSLELLKKLSKHKQVLAIGEIGIDARNKNIKEQQALFYKQVEIANSASKPVIIHMVKSTDFIMEAIKKVPRETPWIIHGFRGSKELAQQYLNHNINLSYGFKHNQQALLSTPHDKLFFETDEYQQDIHILYQEAAKLLKCSTSQLINQVKQNIHKLFFS